MNQQPDQDFKWTVWCNNPDGSLNRELTENFVQIEKAQPYVNRLLSLGWKARLRRYKPPRNFADCITQEDEARLDPGYHKRSI